MSNPAIKLVSDTYLFLLSLPVASGERMRAQRLLAQCRELLSSEVGIDPEIIQRVYEEATYRPVLAVNHHMMVQKEDLPPDPKAWMHT